MGRIVIAAYRPKPGKGEELVALTREHYPILREQGLVTKRRPMIGRAADGTIVEAFEWEAGAIERAHSNPAVLELWKRYEAVCEYVPLAALGESANLFAEFEAVN
ncbi:MAG: hypothetical protein JO113_09215 [Candidatus Eremiobacteraeota bacterium]|nr:hypothetical protein [Candidatus Eremiobacteraeota bacterium]